ncbi:Pci8p [Kluyveromyces lactis]|uniref:COP9 signalosome complex subunit 11 n=1 Tax=Kluyveromyces lactis (strain ATCC 8585 / CBS 2359 / DSM 70799 / NBRC 1267 / NRRL Y-1140 / WM37) TaxID=284590 RepID=CSN11_KLULA|nr:uncharacterized protein KLLA0_C07667g [Kluyveromyces lactis]Q6CU48.1 RecName: Full=COP9 signalosome complex subunit 11 [Kluyveromyces lactis NRRL Y-1140]CAH01392.1 KLLA0C07667p [Kluyveromyces lactis]|eukprot:XP_452541.1 uncharacterized protein KLLA0_C07667g [Kluyveromyces lactis]
MTQGRLFYPLAVLQDRHFRSKYPNYNESRELKTWSVVSKRFPAWEQKLVSMLLDNKYAESIIFINSDVSMSSVGVFKRTKLLIRTHILNSHYKAVIDFESRLNTQPITSEPTELADFIECKLLLILNWFLRGEYHQCLQRFIQLIIDIPNLVELMVTLPKDDIFISNETMFYIITVSALVSIPLDNLDTFIHLEELEQFHKHFDVLAGKGKLIINSKFMKFFDWWHNDMERLCKQDYFLEKKWDIISKTMRQKMYAFYLRIATKIQISYLSERVGISREIVTQEITQLISEACLNFQIHDDLILYQKFDPQMALNDLMMTEDITLDNKLSQLRRQNHNLRVIVDEHLALRKSRIQRRSKASDEEPMNEEEVFALSENELCNETADTFND